MAEPEEFRPIDYHRFLPFLYLGRAFRMAVDPRKLLLAGLALLSITALDALYNEVRFSDETTTNVDDDVDLGSSGRVSIDEWSRNVEELARPNVPRNDARDEPAAPPADDLRFYMVSATRWPWETFEAVLARRSIAGDLRSIAWEGGTETLLGPLGTITEPLEYLLFRRVTLVDRLYLVVRLLWALAVWAIVAGAITRMVALEFARDERLGTAAAIKYAVSRFFSFLFAPVIAVICLAVIVLFCWLGGLIGFIPGIGPIFAGVLWFLPLIAGFIMALILVGAALGWPLMYATISTQDSDAFDGFSRSYTFVYGRPWYYALLAVVTVLLAAVGFGIVYLFTAGADQLSQGAVALGMSRDKVDALLAIDGTNSGTYPAVFWRRTMLLLAGGFGASFFWVASTVAYFLLRRADDGTELDEVEVQYDAPADTLAPLAGVPASEPATPERPIVELSTEPPTATGDAPSSDGGEPETPAEGEEPPPQP